MTRLTYICSPHIFYGADNPDINTPEGTNGATRFQTFIDTKGQRSSAATAYLPSEVRRRPNLHIAVGALITRVLFNENDGNQPVAQGVEIQTSKGGPLYQVHCLKEVILCAGAINTPQTLQLSGIGPKDILEKAGIPIVKELDAVGRNLKDHFCTSTILCKAKAGVSVSFLANHGIVIIFFCLSNHRTCPPLLLTFKDHLGLPL